MWRLGQSAEGHTYRRCCRNASWQSLCRLHGRQKECGEGGPDGRGKRIRRRDTGMKPGPRATSTIKVSKKGVAQGLLRGLSLFEGSVPSEQIRVCNWVPTGDCIKVEPLQDSASWQKTLDLVDLLKSRKFALRKVTQCYIYTVNNETRTGYEDNH